MVTSELREVSNAKSNAINVKRRRSLRPTKSGLITNLTVNANEKWNAFKLELSVFNGDLYQNGHLLESQ